MSRTYSKKSAIRRHKNGPNNLTREERFWEKVQKSEEPDGCWIWQGAVSQTSGHGSARIEGGKAIAAHRASWMFAGLPLQDDDLKHRCPNQLCVRPDHLYFPTREDRFWTKVNKDAPFGCWLWTGVKNIQTGYGMFVWEKRHTVTTHRASWVFANGPVPDGLEVCHNCDKNYPLSDPSYRACVNPSHLFLGTHLDNIADAVKKRRHAWGERHGSVLHPETILRGEERGTAKTTEADVLQIRTLYATGKYKLKELGQMFDLSLANVHHIVKRRTWTHI